MIVLERLAAAVPATVVVGLLTASTAVAAGGEAGTPGRGGLRPSGASTALAVVQAVSLYALVACLAGLVIAAVRSVVLHHHRST